MSPRVLCKFNYFSDKNQRWKLDGNKLKNKEGLWKSDDLWNFKFRDDGLLYIENISKTKVLEAKSDGKVILEDFEENKAEQLWQKGNPDAKGYFILVPSLSSSVKVPKVITAISESGLEIKGNITLRWIPSLIDIFLGQLIKLIQVQITSEFHQS